MGNDRGVIYYTFGNDFPNDLMASVNSVRKYNKGLPIAWVTETPNHKNKDVFDIVIPSQSKKTHGWHKRTESLLLTPFDNTLHLDSDTIINGDLSYGFNKSETFDISLCHAPAYYGGSFIKSTSNNSLQPLNSEQIVYNAGVIFYRKCDKIWDLLNKWITYNDICKTGQDQGGLSNAIEYLNINPFILSKSWNFRSGIVTEGYGPIKIWHSHNKIKLDKINNKGFFKV
jgi:hypothetical protein